jgi:uncharacterized peroxidase-related enzyme
MAETSTTSTISAMPAPRLSPLPVGHAPELVAMFEARRAHSGFVPNSLLVMQRKPRMVEAFVQLVTAVLGPGEVDPGFRRLVALVANQASGCRYCMAHSATGALESGIDKARLAAVWEYRSSPLFTEAEKVAFDFALAASSVPNDVTDELFASMRRHWSESEIVEITGVVSLFGFLNRWNETMLTPLEEVPLGVGDELLAPLGWDAGRHGAPRFGPQGGQPA